MSAEQCIRELEPVINHPVFYFDGFKAGIALSMKIANSSWAERRSVNDQTAVAHSLGVVQAMKTGSIPEAPAKRDAYMTGLRNSIAAGLSAPNEEWSV